MSFAESLPLLREMLLTTLLSGGADVAAAVREAPRYQLTLTAPQYAVAVLRTPTDRQALPADLNDPELMKQAVINVTREVLGGYCPAQVFHFDGMVAVLFLLPDAGEAAFLRVQEALDAVRKTVARFLDVTPSIGLGRAVRKPRRAPRLRPAGCVGAGPQRFAGGRGHPVRNGHRARQPHGAGGQRAFAARAHQRHQGWATGRRPSAR